jgi:hypothetical protein
MQHIQSLKIIQFMIAGICGVNYVRSRVMMFII